MFCRVILFLVLGLRWISLCASDIQIPLLSDSQPAVQGDDLVSDISYRCGRSVLELPPRSVASLFNITRASPYDLSKDAMQAALHDLWGNEEIIFKKWIFSEEESDFIESNFASYPAGGRFSWQSPSSYCFVKVWRCVRNFQDTSCLDFIEHSSVGSVWFFWSNITTPSATASKLSAKLFEWCGSFADNELIDREILFTARSNGIFPAMMLSKWFTSENKGQNLKVVFFNSSVDLPIETAEETIPLKKALLINPKPFPFFAPVKYKRGITIEASSDNIAQTYEAGAAAIISSLDMPERAGDDGVYVKVGVGLTVVGTAVTVGTVVGIHLCVVS